MLRIALIVSMLGMFLLCALSALWAEDTSIQSLPSLYLRPVPNELETRIAKQLKALAKKYPVSQTESAAILEMVGKMRVLGDNTSGSRDEVVALERRLMEIGTRTIPVVAPMLQSQEDRTRQMALSALKALLTYKLQNYADSDSDMVSALASLYRRSTLDRNPTARMQALAALCGVGAFARDQRPSDVVAGIERVELDDPEPSIRRDARSCRTELGFVKPESEVYYKDPPEEFQPIRQMAANCMKKRPLSDDVIDTVRWEIMSLSPTATALNDVHRDKIKQIGVTGLPVMERLLPTTSGYRRARVIVALGYLVESKEQIASYDKESLELITLLLRRTLYDKDSMVRAAAVAGLATMAMASPSGVPDGVEKRLKMALDDPDGDVRQLAEFYVKGIESARASTSEAK